MTSTHLYSFEGRLVLKCVQLVLGTSSVYCVYSTNLIGLFSISSNNEYAVDILSS